MRNLDMLSFLTFTLLFSCGMAPGEDSLAAVRAHREKHGAEILRMLADFAAIPNVSSNSQDIARNAAYLRDALTHRGINAELWKVPGASPVVFGELRKPGCKRTIGFYAHYDGQPVDRSKWTHSPWTPTLYTRAIEKGGKPRPLPKAGEKIDPRWRLYARSAGDDKAPIVAMLAALDAFQENHIAITSNLKFFWEGEEEIGSPHLSQYFDRYRDRLDVDIWIICDGPSHPSGRPQLVFGVRGITGLDVTVYGATRYLHSGHYGNWAPNPALRLAQLLASMKDDNGRVQVEGFYDTVGALGPAERAALTTVPEIDDEMRKELGLAESEAHNAPYAERLLLPTFNIRGLVSGAVGEAARNVIPPSATASMDIRLVKGNDPEAMLGLVENHIRKQGYYIVRKDPNQATRLAHPRIAKVIRHLGYKAARTPMDRPDVQQVIQAATHTAGQPMITLPTMGGSLPLYLFTDKLKMPAVIAPIANHDDNQHGPDENLRLSNLWYGMDLMAALFTMPR